MSEEHSEFLINQERIMAQRARQERDREALQIVPAVVENPRQILPDPRAAQVVSTQDLSTGEVTHRVIPATAPVQQRFTRPETPTTEELQQSIFDLLNEIENATDEYETVSANLDAFFAPHKALEKRISELKAALAQAEADLAKLRAAGSPAEGFKRFVADAEAKVSGLARQIIDRYSTDKAREKFDVEFHRLSQTTQNDIQLAIRYKLERFASQFYPRLARNLTAGVDAAKARASELLRDLKTILEQNF